MASGSVRGDLVEAAAIEQVFGDEIPVVAHKGNFGNIGGGTSIVELIGAILTMKRGIIPPTINCDFVDPACHVNVITSETSMEKRGVLKSSFFVLGTNRFDHCRISSGSMYRIDHLPEYSCSSVP